MGVFFNGRLWVSPATASYVDDSAMANLNLSVGNVLALIGPSVGGQPNTPLVFGSASDAKAALIDGYLLRAIEKAFDPSSETTGPSTIVAIRVNPATQATLAINDAAAANIINLMSTDYGLYTNQIKAKIEAGSVTGYKLTTQLGTSYYSQDNVAYSQFSVQYTGAQVSAAMSINNTTLTLFAPTGTNVATIDLNTYNTIQKVVDRINAVTGFNALVLGGNGLDLSLNELDTVANQDVKTAVYTATANLQAVVDWFNSTSDGYVNATRVPGAGTMPALIPFTYLSGATDGTVTNTNWSNAFTVLQSQDVQWVVPITPLSAIHAMTDAHCAFMSNIARMERRAIVGPDIGTTDAAAELATGNINSDRTSYTHLGFYDYDPTGALVLFPPYIMAALLAGMFSGVNPGTALTNKSIKVRGLERKLRNPTDTDPLILGGVLCVESTSTGYKVVKSITTWLNNKNYNRVEVSVGVGYDFVSRNVRNAIDVLRGSTGSPATLLDYVSKVDSTLRLLAVPAPIGPGVLVGDKANPAYKNITASLVGDVVQVQYQCSVGIPTNYIMCVVHAVPYSGTATA